VRIQVSKPEYPKWLTCRCREDCRIPAVIFFRDRVALLMQEKSLHITLPQQDDLGTIFIVESFLVFCYAIPSPYPWSIQFLSDFSNPI